MRLRRVIFFSFALGLLAVCASSLRHTRLGIGFVIPKVFAQQVFQQKCLSPLQPIVGPSWQISNSTNDQLLQWGCLDNRGNLQIGTTVYVGKAAENSSFDVQMAAAMADLPNGGFLDARLGAVNQTVATTIDIGGTNQTITAWFDRTTKFTCTITNNTPCWRVNGGSSMVAFGTVAIPNAGFTTSATASVSNVLLVTNNIGAGQVGNFIEGMNVNAITGATVSDAICANQNTLQLVQWQNVSCYSAGAQNTVVLKIYATSGTNSVTNPIFHNTQIDGQGNTGVRPVWIGCTAPGSLSGTTCSIVYAVNFFGGLMVHPGPGLPIATVTGINGSGGQNQVHSINFFGEQIESSSATDIGIEFDGVLSGSIYGLVASCGVGGCGTDMVRLTQPAGTALDGIDLRSLNNQGTWTNLVNNQVTGETYGGGSIARLNYAYSFGTRLNSVISSQTNGGIFKVDGTGIITRQTTINPVTFATLPASTNGSLIFCSDCNATCAAGGGTGRMCARENGAWVGF